MNSLASVRNCLTWSVFALAILCLTLTPTKAQQHATDGATPLGLAPGSPAGSYPLSDIESVNLFNGGLNFSIPIVKVEGRGDAAFPIMVRVQRKWLVEKEKGEEQPPINYYYAKPDWWTDFGWAPVYSMGGMEMRQGGSRNFMLASPCGYVHQYTLTRLTFIAPDGTEYELRDQQTNGQPVAGSCSYYNRGTVFVSADGTGATFISDAAITDYPFDNPANTPPSGYMMLRDGTRFRVDGGKLSWMRDRNGNKISFTFDTLNRLTNVTDSLNRQVTISYNTGPGTYDQVTFSGYRGATRTIKVHFAYLSNTLRSDQSLQTVAQLFPELNGGGGYYDSSVISAIELSNGQQYQFRYDSYAELARVVLPTGGAIEYDYAAGLTDLGTSGVISGLAEKHIYRRVVERRAYPDGSSGSSFASRMTYSRPETNSTNAGYVTTDQYNASGTLLTRSLHYFYGSARASFFKQPHEYPAWTDSREYKTETFAANGSTLLRRTENTFEQRAAVSWWTGGSATAPPNDVRLTETVTTLADTNQVSKQVFGYDDSVPFNNRNSVKDYNYGNGAPGTLLRETQTSYLTSSTYTGTSVHLRSLPTQVSIFDGNGVERARTTFEYDNYTTDTSHTTLTDRSSISGLDSAFTTGYTTRGNLTGQSRYLLTGGSVTGSVASYLQYDIAGNVTKSIDARGNATTFFYADCFGIPNGEARSNTAPTGLGGLSSFAFVTKVTNALSQSVYLQFDYDLGRPVDSENLNGTVTSGIYDDSLDRPTQIQRAVGTSLANQTTFSYDDTNRIITVSLDRDISNDKLLVSKVIYDQMGRISEKRQFENTTDYIATQTQYDVLGRAFKTSNPFRPLQSETAVWTTSTFDSLGRVTSVTTPDSAVVTTSYNGNSTTETDQNVKARKTVTDAFGRLIEVYEDPAGLNYQTTYGYDVLDDLITITQGSQTRTFTYDSLQRPLSGNNPENGTVSYQYDEGNNLLVKTDARGVSTHFAYDPLDRITRRWYNGSSSTSATTHNSPVLPSGVGATDEVNFYYDSQSLPSGAPSFSRGPSIGKQVAATYGTGSSTGEYFGYDLLGRAVVKIQQTGTVNYPISAGYNLASALTSITYPSGHTTTNAYDLAGRVSSVGGSLGDGTTRTYSNAILYSAFGGLVKEQFGTTTPIYNKLFYNVRGQLAEIRESTSYTGPTDTNWNRGAIINSYSDQCTGMCSGSSMTDNNGNLHKQEVYIPNDDQISSYTMRWQQYDYDSLNRLNWSREVLNGTEQWKQGFTYDRWSNRTINSGVTYGSGINNKAFSVDSSNNRLIVPSGQSGTLSYDAAGNLTNDTYTGAGNRTYDAENKITSAVGASSQSELYAYDASGQRIKRTVDGVTTWQVYGLGGELLAEYPAGGAAPSPQKEYGYRNGQLLVTAEAPLTFNGYTKRRAITLDHAKVPNTDQSNFPILIKGTYSYLATLANGGNVQNANGYDVIFTSDSGCNTKLDHEVETYTASTGTVNYWVKVPTLSHTTDTTIYLCYGNSSVTTDQSNKTAVWDSNYKAVYHLPDGSTLSASDSTTNGNNGTKGSGATAATGNIGGGMSLTGVSNQHIAVTSNAGLRSGTVTVSAWVKTVDASVNRHAVTEDNNVTRNWTLRHTSAGQFQFSTFNTSGTQTTTTSSTNFSLNTWHLIVGVFDGATGTAKLYADGSNTATTSSLGTLNTGTVDLHVGAKSDNPSISGIWNGTLDEVRYSSVVRSSDWIATEYNNQSSPSTFYTISSASGAPASFRWLVTDHLGTLRMILDETGALANIKRHDYLPFGEELLTPVAGRSESQGYASGDQVRQQFTQKERDAETGLDYFQARYYSSTQGRFVSADSFGGSTLNPQTLNLYSYVSNNPLTFTDPTGHKAFPGIEGDPCKGQPLCQEGKRPTDTKPKPPPGYEFKPDGTLVKSGDKPVIKETVNVTAKRGFFDRVFGKVARVIGLTGGPVSIAAHIFIEEMIDPSQSAGGGNADIGSASMPWMTPEVEGTFAGDGDIAHHYNGERWEKDVTLYRYFDEGYMIGPGVVYLSADLYSTSAEARARLALSPSVTKNKATMVVEVTVPATTIAAVGRARGQDPVSKYPGGGSQVIVGNPGNLRYGTPRKLP